MVKGKSMGKMGEEEVKTREDIRERIGGKGLEERN